MRYQIYEAKSVKYDAQQRVGIIFYLLTGEVPPINKRSHRRISAAALFFIVHYAQESCGI